MTSHTNLYVLGAAVVGIVSAAGIFIVEHFRHERRRHAMAQDLARMDRQLSGMQKELEQLRLLQKERNTRLKKVKSLSLRGVSQISNVSLDDYGSTAEADSSDLEFYDLSDEETTLNTVTPLDQILKEIDEQLNMLEIETVSAAFNRLKELNREFPHNPELLWRLGKAYHKMMATVEDVLVKQDYTTKGIEACQAALDINGNIADAHKWYAILIGARSSAQSIQGKISDGYLFKKHIDVAITINPNDATLHHMLGRFTYESANLKWYERKVATTFFSEPPSGTFDEALDHFLTADRLSPNDWKENKLLIGKCQIALGKYKEAVEMLAKADALVNDSLDMEVDSEVKILLQKYNSYR